MRKLEHLICILAFALSSSIKLYGNILDLHWVLGELHINWKLGFEKYRDIYVLSLRYVERYWQYRKYLTNWREHLIYHEKIRENTWLLHVCCIGWICGWLLLCITLSICINSPCIDVLILIFQLFSALLILITIYLFSAHDFPQFTWNVHTPRISNKILCLWYCQLIFVVVRGW